jgi:hypothetical protein
MRSKRYLTYCLCCDGFYGFGVVKTNLSVHGFNEGEKKKNGEGFALRH